MAYLRQRKNSEQRESAKRRTYVWEVEFYRSKYDRQSFSIGRLTQSQANEVFRHVSELIRANEVNQQPDSETQRWAEGLNGSLKDKLVALGLLVPVARRALSQEQRKLGTYLQLYIDVELATSAERTRNNYGQTRSWLIKHFGEDRRIETLTPQDMKRWQRTLSGLAISNRNKHVQRAKTMFRAAVNDRLLNESPAKILKEESQPRGRIDRSRQFFVDSELTERVMSGLPDNTWQLIFALLRFQGFRRCEVFSLTWQHVDWENDRLQVHSPKTGFRECPLFPETRQYLGRALDAAPDGALEVVHWERTEASLTPMLKTRVAKIVGSDNVWPKICQQLRSTRRTELEEHFPAHVCDEWLGHDDETAKKHYKQVTPDHWEQAKNTRYQTRYTRSETRFQDDSAVVTNGQKTKKPLENVAFPGVEENWPIPRRGVGENLENPGKNGDSDHHSQQLPAVGPAISNGQDVATVTKPTLVDCPEAWELAAIFNACKTASERKALLRILERGVS